MHEDLPGDRHPQIRAPFPTGSTTIPILGGPTSFPLIRGVNAVTLAPAYTWNDTIAEYTLTLAALTDTSSGNDSLVKLYSQYPSGFDGAWFADTYSFLGTRYSLYPSGITADPVNGALWGWNASNDIFAHADGSDGFVQTDFTSAVEAAPDFILATYDSNTGDCAGPPVGNCLFVGESATGGWYIQDEGGTQVTYDSILGDAYILDSSGRVWGGAELTDDQCSSGTATFVLIAAKDGIVYGLDSGGTVWYYGGVLGNCWAKVGNGSKDGFAVSIATDNNNFSGVSVWASDASGYMWIAE